MSSAHRGPFAQSGIPVCQHSVQQSLIGFICNIQGADDLVFAELALAHDDLRV